MLVEAEIWTVARTDQGNAVLVRPLGAEMAVPIFIGQLETQSILIGMGNVPMPRPLTHDLFISLLKDLGAELERIEITSLKEGTFFAKLIILQNEKKIVVDTRPSDAMGIAVRKKCPIFIAEAVVDEAGIPLSSITEQTIEAQGDQPPEEQVDAPEMNETPPQSTAGASDPTADQIFKQSSAQSPEGNSERKRLEKALEKAVNEENYEEAAKIRDQLKELEDTDTT
ncbi:MAG: bifunctional nuclease domain-containing protein [Spirochaetaceae bacterium]